MVEVLEAEKAVEAAAELAVPLQELMASEDDFRSLQKFGTDGLCCDASLEPQHTTRTTGQEASHVQQSDPYNPDLFYVHSLVSYVLCLLSPMLRTR